MKKKLLKPLYLQGLGVIPEGTPLEILKVTSRTVHIEIRSGLKAVCGKSYFYKGRKKHGKKKNTGTAVRSPVDPN